MINNNKVMVFSKSYCPFAGQAKKCLQDLGVKFEVIELDVVQGGDALHAKLKQVCGKNTVPQTYIDKKHVGGCDDLLGANKSGKLVQMLDAAGVEHK